MLMPLEPEALLDPVCGFLRDLRQIDSLPGEPETTTFAVRFPWYGIAAANKPLAEQGLLSATAQFGSASGTSRHPARARLIAIAEAVERHAAYTYDIAREIVASAMELGEGAVDLQRFAQCSDGELSSPHNTLSRPDKGIPIRWIAGRSLLSGKEVLVPASVVYLHIPSVKACERFQVPISTGLAAHTSLMSALRSGILEVVERDALSLTWLQKLPAGSVDLPALDPNLIGWIESRWNHLTYRFLDITTDLGVPVTCCLRYDAQNEHAATLVACAAGGTLARRVEKTVCDLNASAIGYRGRRPVPESFEQFRKIHHGAAYMARAEHRKLFAFLDQTEGCPTREQQNDPINAEDDVQLLLRTLRKKNYEAYAVDLTTPEAAATGMVVVRVIVPELQPLPFVYSSRYLGNRRLYEAPTEMGRSPLSEAEINAWPLPFA